jgi:hypothetical protein
MFVLSEILSIVRDTEYCQGFFGIAQGTWVLSCLLIIVKDLLCCPFTVDHLDPFGVLLVRLN